MVCERLRDIQTVGLCPGMRRLHLRDRSDDEPEMIERLMRSVTGVAAMEREIIASGTQIGGVRIGLPYDAHPEDAHVKLARSRNVGYPQRYMAQSAMSDHSFSSTLRQRSRAGRVADNTP